MRTPIIILFAAAMFAATTANAEKPNQIDWTPEPTSTSREPQNQTYAKFWQNPVTVPTVETPVEQTNASIFRIPDGRYHLGLDSTSDAEDHSRKSKFHLGRDTDEDSHDTGFTLFRVLDRSRNTSDNDGPMRAMGGGIPVQYPTPESAFQSMEAGANLFLPINELESCPKGDFMCPVNVVVNRVSEEVLFHGAVKGIGTTMRSFKGVGKAGTVEPSTVELWLGDGFERKAQGVYRSKDGTRQFRMTPSDVSGKHTQSVGGSHVHVEILDNTGEVIENNHILLKK